MPEPYRTAPGRRASGGAHRPARAVEPPPPCPAGEPVAAMLDEQRGEPHPGPSDTDRRRDRGRHARQHLSVAIDELAIRGGPQQRWPEAAPRAQLTDRIQVEGATALCREAQLERLVTERHAGERPPEQPRDAAAIAQPAEDQPDR